MESTDNANEKSAQLLEALYVESDADSDRIAQLLSDLRILTRETSLTADVLDCKCATNLVELARKHHTEAQKCLSNLILNYAHFRNLIVQPYVECAHERMETVLSSHTNNNETSKTDQLYEVLYYDLRIIFLLSALCTSSRASIQERLLGPILRLTKIEADHYSERNRLLVIESLKTLFNLTLNKFTSDDLAGEVVSKLFNALHESDESGDKSGPKSNTEQTEPLLANLINLLTNMPEQVYRGLSDADADKALQYLDSKLIACTKANVRETVLPALNVCTNISKYKDDTRKRWFDEIMGSVKDFDKRPEEYDTLRGRLVKLMTSVDVHLKDLAADFMHALCGGDTEKFITYTGFGNSAAYLSSRGLLGALNQRKSSGSDENEAFTQIRSKVDPITGKIETETARNPMEGMTDEEKEYHAHELAKAITKLSNIGIVKPMSINPDTGEMKDIHPESSGSGEE